MHSTSTCEHVSTRTHPSPRGERPREASASERERLLDWLDQGLRNGESGRLVAEYPLSLDGVDGSGHRVVFAGEEPLAHAMFHVVEAVAGGRSLRLGLIGLVYTAPHRRREGLARACVESCIGELSRRGIPVAALWAQQPGLYAELGFEPAGNEGHYTIDLETCRRARGLARSADDRRPITVDLARERDWPALEAHYARKRSRAVRARGALKRLASAPETQVVVARSARRPIAYAALGRGSDFPGIIHEWAGNERGVIACLEALCGELGRVGMRCGPLDEAPMRRLREAGASVQHDHFAFVKVLDAVRLWKDLHTSFDPEESGLELIPAPTGPVLVSSRGSLLLSDDEMAQLFFGPGRPGRVMERLRVAERDHLTTLVPIPLYLWGFDSI